MIIEEKQGFPISRGLSEQIKKILAEEPDGLLAQVVMLMKEGHDG